MEITCYYLAHILNYIGHINEENRDTNLKLLKIRISSIISKWPKGEL